MIAAHAELLHQLDPVESLALWDRLWRHSLVFDAPDPRIARGAVLAEKCSHLSHAQVVLTIADRTGIFWCNILDKILKKPIYLCARGETGIPTTDLNGNPLPMPVGHRRGEAVGTGQMPATVYRRLAKKAQYKPKHDPRVIVFVQDMNPKMPGTKSHERFALYRQGMTVSQYVAAGGRRDDIAHDVQKGFIRVDLP